MADANAQTWVGVVGGLVTASAGLLGFFNYRTRRDSSATVGDAFASTVEALSDERRTKQIAAAVMLRRFFDPHTEQGRRSLPYRGEAVHVIAGMLREDGDGYLQKALADGLRYARTLVGADLQQCNLTHAYLGTRPGDPWILDLSDADFYEATLDGASLKGVRADRTVFLRASLKKTVLTGASLVGADFRDAELDGARFFGALIEGAKFRGATNVPPEVEALLDDERMGTSGARVPESG